MEGWWAQKTLDDMLYCYLHQYDDDKSRLIPPIVMRKEDGKIVFKVYGYGNMEKYYTRVFDDDPDSDFDFTLHLELMAETQD
jgi:hypothetical protein